jgi:hypothetical protein
LTTSGSEPDSWARSAAAFDEVADGGSRLAAHGAIGAAVPHTDAAVAAATALTGQPVFESVAAGRQDADTMRATAATTRTEAERAGGGGIRGL